jgi:ABC-type transport system involved in multi-copper enzyme maturation permease subunit
MTSGWEIFRFELAYQLQRVSTRIYLGLFFGFALAIAYVILLDARNDGYFFNAPIVTSLVAIVTSMFALLVTSAVAGDAATRDAQMRIDSLLYTTPLRKASYLGGRFLGAFAITALLLLAVPVGLLLATRMPGLEPQVLGPFRVEAYLTSYFFFAVPNAFVATAVLFSLAAISRRALTAYFGAVILFFAAFVAEGFVGGSLGKWDLARLLDPLGYTALYALWRSYNPLQRNTLLVGLDESLLSNRLLWLGVALTVLTLACLRFRFAHQTGGGRWRRATKIEDVPAMRWTRVTVPAARRVFGAATRMRQLRAITLRSLRELLGSKPWWIVPFVAVLFIVTAPELLEVELGTPGAATTGRVAMMLGAAEMARLIGILIALSAGELVWREREARINSLADVTPVPEWLSLLGRFFAIALMLAIAEVIFVLAGVTVQAMLGIHQFDVALYLKILFGFQLSGYLLFAALAIVIHVLANQKYVGNVLAILSYIAMQMAPELGLEHNLLLYGGSPEWSHSEMAGFGLQVVPWLWFTVYWSGWALLFAVVTYLFWICGEERGIRPRLALARRRLTRWPAAVGAAALAIIAGAGGFIFYNTNVLNDYYAERQMEERKAEYERRYGQYASLPQPTLAATKLHVDFYPDRGAATIRGTYRLENRTNAAIATIHMTPHVNVDTHSVSFDRPSRVTLTDRDLGYRIYALGNAVQPGESLRMNFQVDFAPRGFRNDGRDPSVLRNGSWIEHRGEQTSRPRQWLPVVGYETARELHNAGARRAHRLRERPAIPALDDMAARQDQRGHEKIAFEAIVGTSDDQTGVATGALRRTWKENGRNYAHYVADAPISNGYAIYSARYAVHRTTWRNTAIEIFHHPAHTANLPRMIRSVRASLDYHSREFGKYPHRQLRMIECPSSGSGLRLTAFEGAVRYSEGYALVRPGNDARQIDLPFAVMAHELAHQWWGHRLVPAPVEGAALLTESLAWYSAMLVVEETLGRDHLLRLLDVMRAEHMAPHATREVSLLRGTDRVDAYRNGPFAMFALREALGADRVNAALRNLLAKFPPDRPPYATSLDLYAELRAVAPPDMHSLLKDLFEDVTFWDLRTKKVDVQPAGTGYRLTLQVEAQKLKANALGKETPVPMNDLIEVAAFDADGKSIYRQPHRIRSGAQTITFTVPRAAARAGVDPDHELLDRQPGDNFQEVQPARGGAAAASAAGISRDIAARSGRRSTGRVISVPVERRPLRPPGSCETSPPEAGGAPQDA